MYTVSYNKGVILKVTQNYKNNPYSLGARFTLSNFKKWRYLLRLLMISNRQAKDMLRLGVAPDNSTLYTKLLTEERIFEFNQYH